MNYLWELMGKNSGQLQTLLAIIGLTCALIAAVYAKRQIKLSQDQRLFELKLSILNTAYECKELIYEMKFRNENLKSKYGEMLNLRGQSLNTNLDGYDYNYHEYFKLILGPLEQPEEVVEQLIFEIKDENIKNNLQEFEKHLNLLCTIKGGIYTANCGYLRRIVEMERMLTK
ncbi:hypothetical protein [Acinetobacter sp. WCHAc060033]|uniref:hypothetical protein n=1 Tax=Acinetobacter sp. WCHAc060033 TaxID=2518624 RepID=UPI001D18F3D0|nr:hypothetical protein [Acinetobacter sp. WCHAc060033]